MLTCTESLYKKKFDFRVYGTESVSTKVREFLDEVLEDDHVDKKLFTILDSINTDPLLFSHDKKFKHVEGDVWEIKIHQIRIACVWDKKPVHLIAIYGFKKKTDKWPKQELKNMRSERKNYLDKRKLHIEDKRNGRLKKIQGKR